jgi:hypothetical protein
MKSQLEVPAPGTYNPKSETFRVSEKRSNSQNRERRDKIRLDTPKVIT